MSQFKLWQHSYGNPKIGRGLTIFDCRMVVGKKKMWYSMSSDLLYILLIRIDR